MIVTLVALAMALGGTATAAKTLIRGKDIASGAIGSRQLASGAVTLAKIAPSASAAHCSARLALAARRHASAVARSCPLPQPLLPRWSGLDAADPRLGGIEGIYAYRASSC